jgi:dimeric dUTPase (all-alpha-NTP-PPase superfamily)
MEKFQILSSEQFNDLVDAQVGLNVKYSGEDWAEKIPDSSFVAAAFAELGELLESGPRVGDDSVGWKWWKPYLENDDNNNKIEAVDIIHFTISSMVKRYGSDVDLMKAHYKECSASYESASDLSDENSSGVIYDVLVSMCVFSVACLVPETEKEQTMDMFVFMINSLCNFSKMDADEMFDMYMKKNQLNHKRVEGGYKENTYEKYDSEGNEDNTKLFED